MELEALSVGLASGELLLVHGGSGDVEEVGVVGGGLAAMSWSPDGELLALVSSAGNVMLMNKVRLQKIHRRAVCVGGWRGLLVMLRRLP